MKTLRQLFLDGAIAALVRQKEAYAQAIKVFEEDIAKVEAMNDEQFEVHFHNKVKPGLQDIQFLAGRFDPAPNEQQSQDQAQQA